MLGGNVEDSLHLSFSRILCINDLFENFIQFFMRAEITLPSFKLSPLILLHEKFLQFDWLRAVVFQLNLKYLHVKITNLLRVVV